MAITLRIFVGTGVRLGEATGLRSSDVGDRQLRVLGNGGDERTVPYGRTLDAGLRRYLSRELTDSETSAWRQRSRRS
jgi:integrase/recombinase XerC